MRLEKDRNKTRREKAYLRKLKKENGVATEQLQRQITMKGPRGTRVIKITERNIKNESKN